MMNNKTGFLIRKDDPLDLFEKLKKLIDDKEVQETFGKNGRNFIEENFHWNTITKNFIKNITELN